MNYNFKKLNTKVLSFDPVNEVDKIIFNHYIMRKENKNRLTKELENGQFKMTVRTVMKDLNFSQGKSQRIIKEFEDLGIIKVVFRGDFKSDYSIYEYITEQKDGTGDDTGFGTGSDTPKTVNNNTKKCDDINTSSNNSSEGNLPSFDTVSGTGEDTGSDTSKIDNINIYLNNNIYNSVIDYLNKTAKKRFKPNTPKTKRLINTRLKEGFVEKDFFYVIDVKSAQWLDTDMEKFLRPETLFSNKFEGYLNEFVSEERKLKESNTIEEKGYWDIQFDF